jgi:glycosyltransferase involved in cell wall biosynthesis
MIKGAKTIVTVNDLFQLKGGQKNWKNSIKTWPLKRADKIIAISYYVKNDLIEFLKVDPGKIKIIYDGFDRDIFRLAEDPKKVEKFRQNLLKNRAKKYLFYIGSFIDHEPRKNLDFLLEIFEKFLKKSDENIKLVIVGKTGSESERLINLAKKTGVADKIIFTGYLEKDEELPLYFQAAEMLIFPSLLEGFGLPLLQAMACGTPVVSSNTSSLPEVMGEGGVLIDPQNINAWVEEIMRIVDEPEYRQKLIKQGLNQAEKFSWEKCARETLEIYKEVYQGETR